MKIGQFCQVINEAKLGEKFPLARRMRVLLDASRMQPAAMLQTFENYTDYVSEKSLEMRN